MLNTLHLILCPILDHPLYSQPLPPMYPLLLFLVVCMKHYLNLSGGRLYLRQVFQRRFQARLDARLRARRGENALRRLKKSDTHERRTTSSVKCVRGAL